MKPKSMVVTLLLVFLTACSVPESETEAVKEQHPAMDARTLILQSSNVPEYYITSGVISSEHRVTITSRISGYIRVLPVREGDRVKKGQLLVRVDPVNAKQALAQARANFADAETDFKRYRKLQAEQAVNKQQFDKVRLRFKVARSRAAQAKNQLIYAEIRSPVNGLVVRKSMNVGDLSRLGAPILTVEDVGRLLVETDVPANAIDALHTGGPVDVSIPTLQETRSGHIRQLVGAADPASHQFHIKIALDSTDGIRAGMFAEVKFRTGAHRAITVPVSAVVHRAGLTGIYIVDRHGIVHYRQIRLGRRLKSGIEATAGLSAGERIAWNRNGALRTGMRIRSAAAPANDL